MHINSRSISIQWCTAVYHKEEMAKDKAAYATVPIEESNQHILVSSPS